METDGVMDLEDLGKVMHKMKAAKGKTVEGFWKLRLLYRLSLILNRILNFGEKMDFCVLNLNLLSAQCNM